jgi:hypothetical protein
MSERQVVWPKPIRKKLLSFHNPHFASEENLDFISQFVLEVEQTLKNAVVSRYYIEEYGEFQGVSRIVIRKFKVYFEVVRDIVIIRAVKFPLEN